MMTRFLLRAETRAVLPHGCVLHASCVAENDRACLFLAPSGGGKSTVMRTLCNKGFHVIADDSVVVVRGTDGVIRCLPCGTMKQTTRRENIPGAPLSALFFLEKGSSNSVFPVDPAYAFYRAIRIRSIMAYGNIDSEEQEQTRLFLEKLFLRFPARVFSYKLADDPAEMIRGLELP